MRKYLLGVVAMVLSYSLFSFTEIKKDKTSDGQQPYYFVWDAAAGGGAGAWEQVESDEDFPQCLGGSNFCTAISDQISGGNPSGNIEYEYRSN